MDLHALAFGAHPDDVELGCGGTLARLSAKGYRVGILSLTRAELGTRGDPETRAREFQDAARILQVAVHQSLDLPDGDIQPSWENKLKVIEEIRRYRPAIVFAPYWEDRHPDHEMASALVKMAAYLAGLSRIETGREAFRPNRVVYYPCRFEFEPSFIVDVSAFHERKMQAVQAYQSQFHGPEKDKFGEQETNISRPEFLETIVARDRRYGALIGSQYGEAFRVREPMRLDDPVAFFGPECRDAFV